MEKPHQCDTACSSIVAGAVRRGGEPMTPPQRIFDFGL